MYSHSTGQSVSQSVLRLLVHLWGLAAAAAAANVAARRLAFLYLLDVVLGCLPAQWEATDEGGV